jgi:hypothetical protein
LSKYYRAGVGEFSFVGLLFFVLFGVFSGLGDRVARPCVPKGRFSRCPTSALKCIGPGPLGDASKNFSLVVAYVNVSFVNVAGVMRMPLCFVFVKYITGGVRLKCVCDSCGVWDVYTLHTKNAHNVFLSAPFVGEGRAFS